MKKLILLLMLIPLISFGQIISYNDVMSISSVNMFKKVVIENGFQKYNESLTVEMNEQMKSTYAYGLKKGNTLEEDTAQIIGVFYAGRFSFGFYDINFVTGVDALSKLLDTGYDKIFSEVKEKCMYSEIVEIGGKDYEAYKCNDAEFKGRIGFVKSQGFKWITQVPEKEIEVLR
jgi:hypothetical protein|tara:strand:+ start:174 stop:695 length:522 start_codon:yes stop_codon:yes gene_type:complete